jgi:O-antigen/teichoic acid export membrane protein
VDVRKLGGTFSRYIRSVICLAPVVAPNPLPSVVLEPAAAFSVVEPRPVESSNGRAVRGGAYTLAGHVGLQALKLGGNVLLTRMLPREAFGMMAIVYTVLTGFGLFSDLGIAPSIVQSPRGDDPKFLNTAWTIQLFRGATLFVLTTLVALPIARFYELPDLALLLPVAAMTALLGGLGSTKVMTAERHLNLGRITLIDISCQVAASVVMLLWAWFAPSVWALVWGALSGGLVSLILGHALLSGHNSRPGWDKTAAQELMRFGRWIFLSTLLTFCVNYADRMIFGKVIPVALLGVYSIALTVSMVPTQAMHSVSSKVMFPLFSRVTAGLTELAEVFRSARRLHMVLSGWALSGFIGGGAVAIALIYDASYADAGWMVQLLALGGWFGTPESANTAAVLARGKPGWMVIANSAKLVGLCALIPLGFYLGGFPGALVGYVTSELFRYVFSALAVYRLGLPALWQDAGFSLVLAVASLASWLSARGLEALGCPVFVQALAVFVVVTLVWLRWLMPYLRTVLHKIQGRSAANELLA